MSVGDVHEAETVGAKRAIKWRWWTLALVLTATLGVGYVYGGRWYRRAVFQMTGSMRSMGYTYYLPPQDKAITAQMLQLGHWERSETEALLEFLRPGDTFIDVGAAYGWYTVIAAGRVGPQGRVIAFEPAPDNRAYLEKNVAANGGRNVKVEPLALSNKKQKLSFYLDPANFGDHSLVENAERSGGKIEVDAVTMDEYLKGFVGRISLIKIDTQGAEGFIFDGMQETLEKNPDVAVIVITPSPEGDGFFSEHA